MESDRNVEGKSQSASFIPIINFITISSPMVTMRHHGTYGVSLRNTAFCPTLLICIVQFSQRTPLITETATTRSAVQLTRSAFSLRYELKLYVLRTNASLKPWLQKWRIKIIGRKCSTVLISKLRSHYSVNSFIYKWIGRIGSDIFGLPSTPHLPTYRCVQQKQRLKRINLSLNKFSPININMALTI